MGNDDEGILYDCLALNMVGVQIGIFLWVILIKKDFSAGIWTERMEYRTARWKIYVLEIVPKYSVVNETERNKLSKIDIGKIFSHLTAEYSVSYLSRFIS